MYNGLLGWLVLLAAAPVLGQTNAPRFEELAREFDYDAGQTLDAREVGRERRDGATVIDLSYASPRGGRVPAYLVIPARGRKPFAAVLFGHWMMPGSPLMNRREFLEEALVLARADAVSLLIDTPQVRPGHVREKDEMREAEQGSEMTRRQVVDLRRGVDLLLLPYCCSAAWTRSWSMMERMAGASRPSGASSRYFS